MIARVSSTDSVVCEMYATLSRVTDIDLIDILLGFDQDDVVGSLAHESPQPPRARHGRASTMVYPSAANFFASTWTLVTSGQVASIVWRGSPSRVCVDTGGDAVGREHHGRALWHLGLGVDEHSSPGSQLLDHVRVVDDFPTHVDGGAVQLECARDGLHGAIHARAIAAWRGQQQLLGSHHCTV